MLSAARAVLGAGAPGRAMALLAAATRIPGDELRRTESLRLRGSITCSLGQGNEGAAMLLQAARSFEHLDVRRCRDTYLEAMEAAVGFAPIGGRDGLGTIADAATRAPKVPRAAMTPADHLLDGLASLYAAEIAISVATIRPALAALKSSGDIRWYPMGCLAAMEIWDEDAVNDLTIRHVQLAREAGGLTSLSFALYQLGWLNDLLAGRIRIAEQRFTEAGALRSASGAQGPDDRAVSARLMLAVWRGRSDEAHELVAGARRDAFERGLGRYVAFLGYATAVLENGLGRYEAALDAAQEACADDTLYVRNVALPELVEAAARSGRRAIAELANKQLAVSADATGGDLALGTLARSRALVAEGDAAEALYREAIDRLGRSRAVPYLARARLLYGEWLRRERRPRDARRELKAAREIFESMGAEGFANRARAELEATGEHVRARSVESVDELTPQEGQIARLAADGASNPEIAAQLFLSRRTIEYHLGKVFTKLGISSRTQLFRALQEHG
jgi:DNA-binding CsgD family transcriptional regulator